MDTMLVYQFTTEGSPLAVSGSENLWTLVGADATPTTADDFITDATGWKGFEVFVPNTITTAQHLLVGWSTTVSAQTAVATILDALDLQLDATPGTPAALANCAVIGINSKSSIIRFWDNITKIKTISVRGHGGAYPCVVTTIS